MKKAFLVGIDRYAGVPLRGCCNDVTAMRGLLVDLYGFEADGIRVVTDGEATRAAILDGLEWLRGGAAGDGAGEVRLFCFSGHGTQQADPHGDEADGADECLVPYDRESGLLTDDELGACYDRFPPRSNLTLIMDCCHSGTIQRKDELLFRFLRPSEGEAAAIDEAASLYSEARKAHAAAALRAAGGTALPTHEFRAIRDRAMAEFDEARALTARFGFPRPRRGDAEGGRSPYAVVPTQERTILLAAAAADELAGEAPVGGQVCHGLFTYYLIDALRRLGPALTPRALLDEIAPQVRRQHTQTPQFEASPALHGLPLFAPLPMP